MGQTYPRGIAVDGTNVYWANFPQDPTQPGGSVMKCAVAGCAQSPTPLASPVPGGALSIAVDATSVYWTNPFLLDGTVMKCAKDGCGNNPTTLASSQRYPCGIAVAGTSVYWTNNFDSTTDGGVGDTGSIMKCDVGGCGGNPTVLASAQTEPCGIAVDGTNVYWTNAGHWPNLTDGTVMKCAIGGCGGTPTLVASNQVNPFSIAVDANALYWRTGDGNVMKLDIGTNISTTLASGQPFASIASGAFPFNIAVDGTSVYWTNDPGDVVMRCAASGCGGNPTALSAAQGLGSGVAVDATSVYWTSNFSGTDGVVLKITPK